jgi:hypothetical protein
MLEYDKRQLAYFSLYVCMNRASRSQEIETSTFGQWSISVAALDFWKRSSAEQLQIFMPVSTAVPDSPRVP